MEQQIGSKLGKDYNKVVYWNLVYLTYMQTTSCEILGWIIQAGIKISRRNNNNLNDNKMADDILMAESKEELKNLLMMVKEESEKADLKLNI